MIKVFSRGIRKIPNLSVFLEDYVQRTETVVVGWGHKATAAKARAYAKENALRYVSLEDGFVRSAGLGALGTPPLSLMIDEVGCYYDASAPSELENTLNQVATWWTPEAENRAHELIGYLIANDLSKYNTAPSMPKGWLRRHFGLDPKQKCLLVIDQTVGDASVWLGQASEVTFTQMLQDAVQNNPGAAVFVRTHPDVRAGFKEGYLKNLPKGVKLLEEDFAPLSTLAEFDAVYTVTSQMGFEAVMLGKPVHVYGLPFYAGWGLTQDRQHTKRRTASLTKEALVYGALIKACRYVNPVSRTRVQVEEICELLAEQKRRHLENRGTHVVIGMPYWKKPHMKAFLSGPESRVLFEAHPRRGFEKARQLGGEVVCWASLAPNNLEELKREFQVPVRCVEDGFLRSCGLGVDFHVPYSLCFDKNGIYYDPESGSSLIEEINSAPLRGDFPYLLKRAQSLISLIVEHKLSKYNFSQEVHFPALPGNHKKILVIGQVACDASVKKGAAKAVTKTNEELLARVRKENPGAFVIYKPHPDVVAGRKPGKIPREVLNKNADFELTGTPISEAIERVDEVHTLTSLAGFEALLAGKKVVTYGFPFYAGWGLTVDKEVQHGRNRKVSREELVVAVLLCYPTYFDWQTKSFCRPEDVCFRLIRKDQQSAGAWALLCRNLFKVKNIVDGLYRAE